MKGSVGNAIDQGAERLFPGYFALVMATDTVFPLGMYAACTFQLGKATGLSFFLPISHYSVYVASLGWVVVFAGLLRRILRDLIISS